MENIGLMLLIIGVWVFLQLVVLPKMGIST